jgi:hypothetical protein
MRPAPDRFPRPLGDDLIAPRERIAFILALAFIGLVIAAIPDFAAWLSTWGNCR